MSALALLALSVTLRAEPARIVLNERDRVDLQVSVPGASPEATVELWSSVGTVTAIRRESRELFRAVWRAPAQRFPQVALLLATVRGAGAQERSWLALPLIAGETLTVTTKPRSRVELSLAGASYGPVRADAGGKARIPVLVPPGDRTAQVRVRDPFGNVTVTTVDLHPPPFPRLRLLALGDRASWADAAPLELEIFAVTAEGDPASAGDFAIAADRGQLGPAQQRAPGVFRLAFRAPDTAGGFATIRASSPQDAQPEIASIALLPGPATEVQLRATAKDLAGSGEVRISAKVVDAHGNALPPDGLALSSDFGSLEANGGEAVLAVPAAHQGHKEIQVSAVAGAAKGTLAIALQPGPPARVAVELSPPSAEAGEWVDARVRVTDAGDNPVAGVHIAADAESARVEAPRELGGGAYALRLRIARGAGEAARLRVRAGEAEQVATIPVLHVEHPREIAVGALVGGRSNLARANAISAQLEVSTNVAASALEGIARAGLLQYAPAESSLQGFSQRAELRALAVEAGVRASIPLGGRFSASLSLLAGAERTFGSLTLVSGASAGLQQGTASWAPVGIAAVGAAMRTSTGRATMELQLTDTPGKGDVGGNTGGVGVSLGYLFALR